MHFSIAEELLFGSELESILEQSADKKELLSNSQETAAEEEFLLLQEAAGFRNTRAEKGLIL